jgi:hypothetical protein
MSNVAILQHDRNGMARAAAAGADFLGPVEVTAVRAQEVDVCLPGGACVAALLALGYRYEACVGDTLLVIGNTNGHYVIGVLKGMGRTVFAAPGDVEVRAVDGVLRLSGDRGVELDAPEVSLRAGTLRMLAGAVSETFTSLRQHVREVLSVRAGTTHQVVEGAAFTQAKTSTLITEGKVAINGKEIHLG